MTDTPALDLASIVHDPADPNVYVFDIVGTENKIAINLTAIPAELRLELLKGGVKTLINNRVNVANTRFNKVNAPFVEYDAKVAADPLGAHTKPEGERPITPDLLAKAAEGREALYKGEFRQRGDGTAPKRTPADPLDSLITKIVVGELFKKNKGVIDGYKITDATKAVADAGGGQKYLEQSIVAKVAAGSDEAALRKTLDTKYIKPARLALGLDVPKALADAESLL